MSAPVTILITKSDLVGVVPQFSANINSDHFAAANLYANERLKNIIPSALYTLILSTYNLSAWASGTAYADGDKVVFNSRGYEANQSTSAGQSPTTHPAKWDEIEIYSIWRDYFKPFLCWQAYAKFLPYHGILSTQGGIKQHLDLSSEPVPNDRLASAIQNAQQTADGYFMDFQNYMSDNSNTIDSVVYNGVTRATFKPKIRVGIVKSILIFMLCFNWAYGQLYPLPTVHEPRNYHFTKRVFVDMKLKVGDAGDPTIARKLHVVADTVRFEGLDGTGTLLTIDANGDIIKGSAGAGAVSGLSNQQVLYGKSDGTIDQEAAFYYNESTNTLRIGEAGSTGTLGVIDGTNSSVITSTSTRVSSASLGSLTMFGERLEFENPLGYFFNISRASSTSDYNCIFPANKGTSGQALYVASVVGDDMTLGYSALGTVTSVALAAGTSGTDVNITGSPITGSGTITLNIPDASTTARGLITTGAQDIAGAKTFTSDISFEGSTADANETTLAITDPTADRTVTIQDITGTIPMAVGTDVSLTGKNAAIAFNTILATPAADGWYRVNVNLVITTAATTSSQIGFRVRYTSAADAVVKTTPNINDLTRTTANTTGTTLSYSVPIYVDASTNIQYETSYTSTGATAAVYAIYITLEKIK